MIPEERDVLDEIITKIRSGRIRRRTFLERAMAVGLSSSAAVSLLEACGGGTNSTGGNGPAANIVWQSENDSTTTYKDLTDYFNKNVGAKQGIHVTWKQGPSDSSQMLTIYNNLFRARSGSIDVISIDIIYPAQFGASQWTKPITDSQWPASERAKYLPGPVQGCTYQGQLWAAPFRTDLGVLYYRKSLVPTPPATYNDLASISKTAAPAKTKYGYVWQAKQYEGLVCDFVEVLHGYGGDVLDPKDSTKVIVNSPEAQQALTQMVSWVGTISPTAITTYDESLSFGTWSQGNAAFMRNWPYAIALSNDPKQSKVVNDFDITSLPYGGSGTSGHSAIGGWNMAINAFSKNPDQAWQFISFMLQSYAQKQAALEASFTVTLQSVYDDPDVLQKLPAFAKFKPILQTALPRPVSAKYTDISNAIQARIHAALLKQVTPAAALSALSSDIQGLVAS